MTRTRQVGERDQMRPIRPMHVLRGFLLVAAAWGWPADAALAGQSAGDLDARVLRAVRAALAPALPYPESDASGSLPADGRSTEPWMVRPLDPGVRTIEILANPLNPDYQRRAAEAMAEIGRAIERAQRRAEAQYDRALDELRRSGRSQAVDGVTLADEGVAGATIDADSHVTVEVTANQPAYRFSLAGSTAPGLSTTSVPGAVAVVTRPAHVYRAREGEDERFAEAAVLLFFGAVSRPEVARPSAAAFDVTATASDAAGRPGAVRSLAVRLGGNPTLIDAILQRADWASLGTLIAR